MYSLQAINGNFSGAYEDCIDKQIGAGWSEKMALIICRQYKPTESPTESPDYSPTESPVVSPTESPSVSPYQDCIDKQIGAGWSHNAALAICAQYKPTISPTESPSYSPTYSPTESPSVSPTITRTDAITQGVTAALRRYGKLLYCRGLSACRLSQNESQRLISYAVDRANYYLRTQRY